MNDNVSQNLQMIEKANRITKMNDNVCQNYKWLKKQIELGRWTIMLVKVTNDWKSKLNKEDER